jgi:biopolymer transport protein ExbB
MQKTKSTLKRVLPFLILLALGTASYAAEEKPPDQMSIIETILHGGPLIVMIWVCILGTSMVLVTFCIQLFMTLRAENLAPKALMESLTSTITAGNYQETWETCKANKSYAAKVLQGALERLGRGQDAVQGGLIEYGLRLAQPIKTKISYISVIGVIAPMIGLLGTVIGMMGAFAVLGSSGVADPRGLALRIGEVLMATASGLFIAIPAFIFYYYFRNLSTIVVGFSDDKLQHLVADIPYEELHGVVIGEGSDGSQVQHFSQASASQDGTAAAEANCPVCNGAISVGETPCPHCGSPIDWGT